MHTHTQRTANKQITHNIGRSNNTSSGVSLKQLRRLEPQTSDGRSGRCVVTCKDWQNLLPPSNCHQTPFIVLMANGVWHAANRTVMPKCYSCGCDCGHSYMTAGVCLCLWFSALVCVCCYCCVISMLSQLIMC